MKVSSLKPTITKKYPIEVPTDQYFSTPCVYRIWFGKRYLIWKGKSLLQSVQAIAEVLERALRLGWDDDTHYFYHVWTYIKKGRITRGTLERLHDDFTDDPMAMLKLEQEYLDAAYDDPDCLNNNTIAYVSGWMGSTVEVEFNKWLKTRKCKPKRSR